MKITRRAALKLGLASAGTIVPSLVWPESAQADEILSCDRPLCTHSPESSSPLSSPNSPSIPRFQQPLPIPTALKPTKVVNNTDYYEIVMQQRTLEIVPAQNGQPAIAAQFWTYNGSIPGPLIRQPKNRQSCLRFINQLGVDQNEDPICTSVHLHGMASLPQYDGYAEDLTQPGEYKDYYYPNNRASILWYHDHAVHRTSRNVYMGLAGMYIVEYAREDFCGQPQTIPLPSSEFEIPLILMDKTLKHNDKGWQLVFNNRREKGVYADILLVNGKPWPYLKVKRRKYFFRLLNASTSRTFQLTLSTEPEQFPSAEKHSTQTGDPAKFFVVGSDAGLLEKKVERFGADHPLRMGVAERYGIVIDFAQFLPGVKHVYLRNLPFSGNLGANSPVVMRFDLEDDPVADPLDLPDNLGILTQQSALIQAAIRPTRVFQFGRGIAGLSTQWTINNRTWNRNFVAAELNLCDTEIWELRNMGGWTHPVHIHLIDFQIISRNGLPPLPYETGWKDVVVLQDFERVLVVARFAPHRG
ncbi:MAG TPA: multicopper oxidase family protein, partial [Stenomitos sp.]